MEQYSLTLDEACAFIGISRPTATAWIKSGRLQATRKDPTKIKSPYLTTREACIAAISSPLHTVSVNAGGKTTYKEESTCLSPAEVIPGMRLSIARTERELEKALAHPTNARRKNSTIKGKPNCGA
ncbi:excisionase [Mangrovibacter sp. MFB070]|nr:excisionase [Mangrovibacter sp. MFB070]